MNTTPRKGLQDLSTAGHLGHKAETPQRRYLSLATLELRKSLCKKLRDVARLRVTEMERKIAELEVEQTRLLATAQSSPIAPLPLPPAVPTAGVPAVVRRRGFTLRY